MNSRHPVWRWLVPAIVAGAVAAPATASTARAEASTLIASERRSTGLSAYGGVLVWSSYSPGLGRYRLMALRQGRVVRLPVRSRRVAFDADVGPDERGRPQVVYSRCAREPRTSTFGVEDYASGRGCRLWRYSFQAGAERRIRGAALRGDSLFRPSVWRSRVVYGVGRRRGGSSSTRVRLLSLRSGRRRPVTVRSRFARSAGAGTAITGLDLSGTRVAVGLDHADVDCGQPPGAGDKVGSQASELFAGPLTRLRRIATACSAGDPSRVEAPSWHRGDIFALVGRAGATGSTLRRRRSTADGTTRSEVDVPPGTQAAATDETGDHFVIFRSAAATGRDSDSFDVERADPLGTWSPRRVDRTRL